LAAQATICLDTVSKNRKGRYKKEGKGKEHGEERAAIPNNGSGIADYRDELLKGKATARSFLL
jgi:hypothetical protein